eukprot:6148348-Lingulodinium_polyedra.AAC.1
MSLATEACRCAFLASITSNLRPARPCDLPVAANEMSNLSASKGGIAAKNSSFFRYAISLATYRH